MSAKSKKLLYVLPTPSDGMQDFLMDRLGQGREVTRFHLYEENCDYGKLLDLVTEHREIITWW